MKAIDLTIITFLLLGSLFLSTLAKAASCQSTIAIVYSNGMFNDQEEAEASKKELFKKLLTSDSAYADLNKYQFYLAFASDGRQYTPPSINIHPILALLDEAYVVANGIGQISEVVLQRLLQEDVSSFWRWLAGKQDGGSRLQAIMNTMAAGTNSASYIYDPDLQKQVGLYKELLNDGKRVVIVSHSQGNFYANASYSQLILTNSTWVDSVGNVQVSSPAASNLGAKMGGDEPQITVNEDMVMNFVQSINLGNTMLRKPDPDSGWSPNMKELGGPAARNAATYGHNFVKWYLAGSYTREFILNGIKGTIAEIKYSKKCVEIDSSGQSPRLILHTDRNMSKYNRTRYGQLYFGYDTERELAYRVHVYPYSMSVIVTNTVTGNIQTHAFNIFSSDYDIKKSLDRTTLRVTPTGFQVHGVKVDVADENTVAQPIVNTPLDFVSSGAPQEGGPLVADGSTINKMVAIPYDYRTIYNTIQRSNRYGYEQPFLDTVDYYVDISRGLKEHRYTSQGVSEMEYLAPLRIAVDYCVLIATGLGAYDPDGRPEWCSKTYSYPDMKTNRILLGGAFKEADTKEPEVFSTFDANAIQAQGVQATSRVAKAWVMEPSEDGLAWVVTPVDGDLFLGYWLTIFDPYRSVYLQKSNGQISKIASTLLLDTMTLSDDDVWRLLGRAPLADDTVIEPLPLAFP